jgi:osmoprotectant transport system ATP-binding protein
LAKKPAQLSGGQQQRVGVARALAADPSVILMDEPFGAVDPITRRKLQDMVLDLQESMRKTIIFVTHDMQEALTLGHRVAVMNQGQLVAEGTAKETAQSENPFVRELVGNAGRCAR